MTRSMRLRDRGWLFHGERVEVDDTVKGLNGDQMHAYKKDKAAADALTKVGYKTVMTDNPLSKPQGNPENRLPDRQRDR